MNDGAGDLSQDETPGRPDLRVRWSEGGGPDTTAAGVYRRTAGGVAPKPGAAMSCHDCMSGEQSKGRASHVGCGVVVPHATVVIRE